MNITKENQLSDLYDLFDQWQQELKSHQQNIKYPNDFSKNELDSIFDLLKETTINEEENSEK